jgi:hypothetical protein
METDAEACKYSWSRISAIELIPVDGPKPKPTDEEIKDATVDLGCGESRQFGLCEASDKVENCIYENL